MVTAIPKLCRWVEADSVPSRLDWRRRQMGVKRWGGAAVLAIYLARPSPFAPAQADDKVFLDYPMDAEGKLAQALNNPLANLITVPIQTKRDFGGARAFSTWFRMRNMIHRIRVVSGGNAHEELVGHRHRRGAAA